MNAYELADELDNMLKGAGLKNNRVPTMLRQQANRIAELEKERKELHKIAQVMAMQESDARKSLQNYKDHAEPDCYGDGNVYRGVSSKDSEVKTYVFDEHAGKTVWASPPQIRELSDEEIIEVHNEVYGWDGMKDAVDFAKAILKKASEK